MTAPEVLREGPQRGMPRNSPREPIWGDSTEEETQETEFTSADGKKGGEQADADKYVEGAILLGCFTA